MAIHRAFLVVTALVAGAGSIAADEVEDLVRRLGSDSYEEREAAQRALVARGAQVLAILDRIEIPDDPEVRARLEMIRDWLTYGRLGPFAGPIRRLEVRLEQDPGASTARRDLGWLYLARAGELDRAAEHFRIVVAGGGRASVRASAIHGLAEIERRRGDVEKAVALHQEGLALRPTSGGYLDLARLHALHLGDPTGAIELCRKSLEIRTTFDYAKLSLAVFLAEAGEREEAARIVDAIYRAPVARHLDLARYHAIVGDEARALDYLTTYLEGYCVVEAMRDLERREIAADRRFENLRDEPRFAGLVGVEER